MRTAANVGLPAEIEVVDEPGRFVYRLPPRALGRWRWVALGCFLVGGFVVYKLVRILWDLLSRLNRPPEWPDLLLGLVVLVIGSVVAYFLLGLGLAIACGRRTIELRGARLRTTERAGPFWRTKKWKIARIERMAVVGVSATDNSGPPEVLSQLYALTADLRDGKRIMIAPAFPRDLLAALSADLAKRCDRMLEMASAGQADPIPVTVAETGLHRDARAGGADRLGQETGSRILADETLDDRDRDDDSDDDDDDDDQIDATAAGFQPADSRVAIERSPSGVTITIPAAGLRAGSKGMFAFSLIWCGGLAVITAFILLGSQQPPDRGLLGPLLFLSLFWLVGIWLMLSGINMGRRRAALAAVDGELMILQTSIYRTNTRQWKAGEVAGVQTGASGIEINDRQVLELQVISSTGDKFGLLAGRDEAELRWLADELRDALHLTELEQGGAASTIMQRDVDTQPRGSRIQIEHFPGGFSMTIGPAGIRRGSQGFAALGSFLVALVGGFVGAAVWFKTGPAEHPIGAIILLATAAIGVSLLLAGINIGLRRGAIAIAHERLLVTQTSFFGSRRQEYEPGEVAAVRAIPAGQSKDYGGLVELEVLATNGGKQSFWCGRDKHELFWMATLIRQALGVPALGADDAMESAYDEPSDGSIAERSDIELDDARD